MRQSHGGKDLPMSEWDELAIKVDKSKRPYLVSYHQLKNGKETEYKVSCFFCHSNGPRAIRTDSPLPLFEKSIITFWNLRIKTYGRMQIKKNSNLINNQKRLIPLQYFGKKDLEPLTIRSCTLCHNESWWSRGQLTRQQDLTIRHLVSSGKMPPWPLSLGVEEKKKLELFLQGF